MNFIHVENDKKKLYNIEYNNYLELFLFDNKLLHDVSYNKIVFKAESIQSLDLYIKTKFLNDDYLQKFIYDLGSQILFLQENNIRISYFTLSDIVIINDTHFLFINPNKLFKKNNIPFITKESNISSMDFIPPELLEKKNINISSLPYSGAYYSLAKLILHVFDFQLENLYYTYLIVELLLLKLF